MVWDAILWTALIFFSRVADVSLGTIRVQMIVRRRKYLAALIGFVEILIYIVIVSRVLQDMQGHWYYVIAYAAGFAVGTLVGMALSQRWERGVVEVTVISHEPWETVEAAVRQAGFALTRYSAQGREGRVDVLSAVCSMRDVARLTEAVTQVDPKAFVYTQELAGLRGGYIYGVKSKL